MKVTRPITKIIAYYRLSKPKKGKNKNETIRDAYGLEDQRREVARLAAEHGAKIIAEFTEIVTGTKKQPRREELEKAISMARLHNATIVIGKQDRLARNLHFITGLMESNVHFICADRPQQCKIETQFRAMIDEEEADRISERTKRAMQVAKSKGTKFGSARPGHWEGREHLRGYKQATKASSLARTQRAKESYRFLLGHIRKLLKERKSFSQIADELNNLGHVTTAGKPFHKVAVYRVINLFPDELVPV
jgi:DNA invertase Pin-like site-specific DNA recombinase